MSDWINVLILAVVQGLTEFLPVSSSGHLAIGQRLLDLEQPGSMTMNCNYDTMEKLLVAPEGEHLRFKLSPQAGQVALFGEEQ